MPARVRFLWTASHEGLQEGYYFRANWAQKLLLGAMTVAAIVTATLQERCTIGAAQRQ